MVNITKEGKEINEKNQSAAPIMACITNQVPIQFIFTPNANNNSAGLAWPIGSS
jgi:hypothetical protein